VAYGFKTLNGELAPWRLRPRAIPMPEASPVEVKAVRVCDSTAVLEAWSDSISGTKPLALPAGSSHVLEMQASVHSTAFLRWTFKAIEQPSRIVLKVTYSEGYEQEPREYPFFRIKADRLEVKNGLIIGPHDEVTLNLPEEKAIVYEPFWFRTFRILRVEIDVGPGSVELAGFGATQVNYPMAVKACWKEPGDAYSERIWDVSIRTMRNCMFDGYSDCPFYEQLQ
jgi:hypothetical protein